MSANRLTEVRCDGCDEFMSEWHLSATQIRQELRKLGWRRVRGQDLCADCFQSEGKD